VALAPTDDLWADQASGHRVLAAWRVCPAPPKARKRRDGRSRATANGPPRGRARGQALILHSGTRQPHLGRGGHNQPGPAVGLLGMTHPWQGPVQGLFEESKRMLLIEAPDVRPVRAPPDQAFPDLPTTARAPARDGPAPASGSPQPGRGCRGLPGGSCGCRAAWFCCLGCKPAQARTCTVPYWGSSVWICSHDR